MSARITLDNAGEVSLMKFSPNLQKPYKLGYIEVIWVKNSLKKVYILLYKTA